MSIAFVKYTEIKYSNFSILGGDKMEQELLKKILKEVEKIGELSNKVDKIDELSNKVDNLGKELKDFKKEVYQLFEKNTREIATVINQLSESISTKNHRNSEETKQRLEKNDKEHRIYEAQIAKLQLTTQYLEEKGKKLA